FDGTAHCVDNAGELDEQPVTRGLNDASAMLLDFGVRQFAAQCRQSGMRALLVLPHEARIAGNVGGQNGGQPALDPLLLPRIHYGWPVPGPSYNKPCPCDSASPPPGNRIQGASLSPPTGATPAKVTKGRSPQRWVKNRFRSNLPVPPRGIQAQHQSRLPRP